MQFQRGPAEPASRAHCTVTISYTGLLRCRSGTRLIRWSPHFTRPGNPPEPGAAGLKRGAVPGSREPSPAAFDLTRSLSPLRGGAPPAPAGQAPPRPPLPPGPLVLRPLGQKSRSERGGCSDGEGPGWAGGRGRAWGCGAAVRSPRAEAPFATRARSPAR